jgi:hypothetical protein
MDKVKELKNIIKTKEVGETSKIKKEVKELEESVPPFNLRKNFQNQDPCPIGGIG